MQFDTPLPIDEALPALGGALAAGTRAVLVAPPGAGKTTRVPLALLDAAWLQGRKILVLEPRRLAARGAAMRMAKTLGQDIGRTVGLRARLAVKVSAATRIEVITEGVFTRMIVDDPSLEGVGAVLFDEYHERSLDADLGLALSLDAQAGLREDLRLLVMSATLDGGRVASLMGDAPLIASEGRSFPVETRYLGRDTSRRIEDQMTAAILKALDQEPGSVLAFLPGQGEIRRVEEQLSARLAGRPVDICPLYGAMEQQAQERAIAPAAPGRRKVVLASAIAESSLTIEGVRVIVDCGLARVPRYEPDVGVTRLETVRVSRASADQRRGRAGRTEPGVCYRLWQEAETQSLPAFAEPEIRSADLSSLVLDLAAWGVADPATLIWLDPPPDAAVTEARAQLVDIGAIDAEGRLTAAGRQLRNLPLPPRIARMLIAAAATDDASLASEIAAILVERGLGGSSTDLSSRVSTFRRDRSMRAVEMRRLAGGWARMAGGGAEPAQEPSESARLLALAYPERIAMARGARGQFLLANGRGAQLDIADPLAGSPFLVVAEMSGKAAATRILLAGAMDAAMLQAVAGDRIVTETELRFDPAAMALRARRHRRLGAITLASEPKPLEGSPEEAAALAAGLLRAGAARLPWSKAQQQLRHRVAFLRASEPGQWPDLSDAGLTQDDGDWLAPYLAGRSSLAQIDAAVLEQALQGLLPHALRRRLDVEAPTHFTAPTGECHPIDYESDNAPLLSIRVQQLFGLTLHPAIAGGRLALTLELLSPAHRPIQITRDLPGFWKGSWASVKAEMRGRYPKHPWPDDPANAMPTARAKPRSG